MIPLWKGIVPGSLRDILAFPKYVISTSDEAQARPAILPGCQREFCREMSGPPDKPAQKQKIAH